MLSRQFILLFAIVCLTTCQTALALKGSKRSSSSLRSSRSLQEPPEPKEAEAKEADEPAAPKEVAAEKDSSPEPKADPKADPKAVDKKNCKKRDKKTSAPSVSPKEAPKKDDKKGAKEAELPYCEEVVYRSDKECKELKKGKYDKKHRKTTGTLKLHVSVGRESDVKSVIEELEETLKSDTALRVVGCNVDGERRKLEETADESPALEEKQEEEASMSGVDFGILNSTETCKFHTNIVSLHTLSQDQEDNVSDTSLFFNFQPATQREKLVKPNAVSSNQTSPYITKATPPIETRKRCSLHWKNSFRIRLTTAASTTSKPISRRYMWRPISAERKSAHRPRLSLNPQPLQVPSL